MATGLAGGLAAAFVAPAPAFAQSAGPPSGANQAAKDKAADEHPLSWHGITLYGSYDIGVGWVSHGLPDNGYNYEGQSLVNKNGGGARFVIAQNSLSQTGLGIRGREAILPGVYGVFSASTGVNPQSGDLANMAKTNIVNNGLPRAAYSYAGDGARAGQVFNDEIYAGISSDRYGTLTFGRQRALGTDAMLQYDPAGGAYAFSFIGYNGLMAGGGDTQDTRWDQTVKYRASYGPVHVGAMYKFIDGQGGCYAATAGFTAATCAPVAPHNDAWGLDGGIVWHRFAADVVYQRVNQAISVVNPLLGPTSLTQPYQSTVNSIDLKQITGANLIDPANTEYGIVTDNRAILVAAKYTTRTLRLYAGFEHVIYHNPKHPLGLGASAQGGYLLSGVEDNNLPSPKKVNVWWTGAKLSLDARTGATFAFYREDQNDFRVPATCTAASMLSSCAGHLDEVSFYLDHHFTRHFDVFAGIAWSDVAGGLAIAIPHAPGVPYYHDTNTAPTLGGRFSF
ncbi:MAG: porin [Sphingomonadales bacterium]|nr:porin [Sphingomonadales bacterium]